MQKGFTNPYIMVLIVVLLAGALVYSGKLPLNLQKASPVPEASQVDETANWKTYTNNLLGIYFKYQKDYSLKLTSEGQIIISLESTTDKSSFQLIIYENPNSLSLKDYEIKNTGDSGMGPNVYYQNAQLIKLQNIEAYYTNEEISCFSKCGSYIWTNKDKIYKLTGSNQNKPDQKQILDNIITTFKFIDQLDETANWKSYQDPKGRFEFKYPSEFNEGQVEDYLIFNRTGKKEKVLTDGLSLREFIGSFSKYKIPDNFSKFYFFYDNNKQKWVHSGGASEFLPRRSEDALEAYIHPVGGGTCIGDRIVIPFPSYINVIEIINTICGTSEVKADEILKDARTNQILSTFKFN